MVRAEQEAAKLTPSGLDPGLGVFFMDLCTKEIDPSLDFDDNGNLARSGTVCEPLLDELLTYKYYQQPALPIGVGN
jgi:1,6-anhydro-N-acetylmuramate kinase